MPTDWKTLLKKKLQSIFWVRVTRNFFIESESDIHPVNARIDCTCMSITLDNCERVQEFREYFRVQEYRDKVLNGEVGLFAESNGRLVGSIWATVNHAHMLRVVRAYIRLSPNQALIHDIVTGTEYRGQGVGPFMVGRMVIRLFQNYRVSTVVIDVNARNQSSLNMMRKLGLVAHETALYVNLAGRLVFSRFRPMRQQEDGGSLCKVR